MKRLQRIESVITIPFFVLSWYFCAIVFSLKAGWLMAQSDADAKRKALGLMLPQKEAPPSKAANPKPAKRFRLPWTKP